MTEDHAGWLREHVARQLDTEAEFEDMARAREDRAPTGKATKAEAHALRRDTYRQMVAELRTAARPSWYARLARRYKRLTEISKSAQRRQTR